MVTQRKPKPSKYLTIPTRPVPVDRDRSVAGLLEKMEGTGFGGRQLAESHRIWLDMLGDNTTITMAASGALIPAGMRRLLAYVVKNPSVLSEFPWGPEYVEAQADLAGRMKAGEGAAVLVGHWSPPRSKIAPGIGAPVDARSRIHVTARRRAPGRSDRGRRA